jgi:hypothetical protein
MPKPNTLIRLAEATTEREPAHILRICADSGCWTTTVYGAVAQGWLYRVEKAHYVRTARLTTYVETRQWEKTSDRGDK